MQMNSSFIEGVGGLIWSISDREADDILTSPNKTQTMEQKQSNEVHRQHTQTQDDEG